MDDTMTEAPWPKRGDNPFKVTGPDLRSSTWTSLRWLAGTWFDDSALSDAFKTVADKAICELKRGEDIRHPDALFLPIAYLHRHSIELKLKALINTGLQLKLEELTEKTQECLTGHSIHNLWTIVRRMLKTFWPNGPDADLNAAEGIVVAFHKIDRSGQKLRYTRDLQGNQTLSDLPESSDLLHVQSTLEALHNMLAGCQGDFSDALDNLNDMRSNYC